MRSFRTVCIFLVSIFALSSSVLADSVSNVRASLSPEDALVIEYDLEGTGVYSVSVSISTDGGTSFPIKPLALIGDVGAGVRPGKNKRIVWDVYMDMKRFADDVVVKVTAQLSTKTSEQSVSRQKRVIEEIVRISIPGGSFSMGSAMSKSESSVHAVSLSGFEMSA